MNRIDGLDRGGEKAKGAKGEAAAASGHATVSDPHEWRPDVEAEKAKIFALQFFVDNSERHGRRSAGQGHGQQQPASGGLNSSEKGNAPGKIQKEGQSGAAKESGAGGRRVSLKFLFMYNQKLPYTDAETGLPR